MGAAPTADPLTSFSAPTRHWFEHAFNAAARALIDAAARLLRANLDRARRATVDGGLAVYGRAGRPCRRCGQRVRAGRQGEQARVTYWCPHCQG